MRSLPGQAPAPGLLAGEKGCIVFELATTSPHAHSVISHGRYDPHLLAHAIGISCKLPQYQKLLILINEVLGSESEACAQHVRACATDMVNGLMEFQNCSLQQRQFQAWTQSGKFSHHHSNSSFRVLTPDCLYLRTHIQFSNRDIYMGAKQMSGSIELQSPSHVYLWTCRAVTD